MAACSTRWKEDCMKPIVTAFIAAVMLAAAPAVAQDNGQPAAAPETAQSPASAPAASPPDYPGLGEIMTLQQLRHIKLWFAGRNGAWALADYEVGELGEGFEDVNKLIGGDTVETMVGGPMKDLQKAVNDKDSAAFAAAYESVTTGCNNCHHALDHGFIVIHRPTSLPYSDQSFAPPK
jgi:hypothetical protein